MAKDSVSHGERLRTAAAFSGRLCCALCVPSMGELQMGFESPVGIPENMKCQNHYLKPTREG